MNILVTGAAGFVASHLIPALLARDHVVTGLDAMAPNSEEAWRLNGFRDHPGYSHIWAGAQDIGTALSIRNGHPYLVIHLAATTDVPFSGRSPRYAFDQVYSAAQAVADYCLASRARMLHFSTFSVYGRFHAIPIVEDVQLRPGSPYGAAKAAAETYIISRMESAGLDAAIIRPATMFGPRERPTGLVSMFLNLVQNGKGIVLEGGGYQTRDLNCVTNVVDLVLAMVADWGKLDALHSHDRIFNAGSGEEVEIRGLAERCYRALNREWDPKEAPPRAWEEGRVMLSNIWSNTVFGYQPRVDFSTGFEDLVEWVTEQQMTGGR